MESSARSQVREAGESVPSPTATGSPHPGAPLPTSICTRAAHRFLAATHTHTPASRVIRSPAKADRRQPVLLPSLPQHPNTSIPSPSLSPG